MCAASRGLTRWQHLPLHLCEVFSLSCVHSPSLCAAQVSSEEAASRIKSALSDCEAIDQPLLGWRRCADTGAAMPPRAEYCRRCKQVTLRMDHHCAFVNTCVGHGNHHYFLRLLALALLSTVIESLSCLWVLNTPPELLQSVFPELKLGATPWSGAQALYAHPKTCALIVLCVVTALVTVAIGVLLVSQLSHVLGGRTFREAQRRGGHGTPVGHILAAADECEPRSVCGNLRSVFGSCLCRHLLPLPCAPVGDGFGLPPRACRASKAF